MRLLSAAAAVVIALGSGQIAVASCIQQTVREQADRAEAIVHGRVVALEGPPGPQQRFAIVDVMRVLKGSAKARIGVALGPGAEGGPGPGAPVATSIDYTAKTGEDHTLYLRQHSPGGFSTDACAGSHAGPPTAEETAMFGPGTPPDPVPAGIGGASDRDRITAGIATIVALAAGAAAIWYARRPVRPGVAG